MATLDAERATPADAQTPAPARKLVSWWDFGAVGGFVAVALYVTSRVWRDAQGVHSTNWPDQAFFEWMLAHGARVVTHLDYPFVSTRLNAPDGVNLMANTSILGLSIPLAPLTLLIGPQRTFAVLLVFAYAATGLAWYYVLSRHLLKSRVAAMLGAAFCAFGPGMISHGNGHPNIVAQFLVPFLIWRTFLLRTRPVRNGVILGLLVIWQAFINEEVLLVTVLGLGVFCLIAGLARREHRQQVMPFLTGLGVAAALAGVVLAYPMWVQFTGPSAYHALNDGIQKFGTDLAAYPAFSRLSLKGDETTVQGLTQNPTEENSFLGWPLLLLLGALIVALCRNVYAIALTVVGLLFAAASLGPQIKWHGEEIATGPWLWAQRLPVFDTVVPTRFALATVPVVALLLALAWERSRGYYLRLALGTGVFLALFPLLPEPLPVEPRPPAPALLLNGKLDQLVGKDQSVVFLPPPRNAYPDPMAWDAQTGLKWRMTHGYFLGPASTEPGGERFAILTAPARPTSARLEAVYWSGQVPRVTDQMRADAVTDVRFWRAAAVVLVPGRFADRLVATGTALFGAEPQWTDGAWVWDVRALTG